MSRIIQIKPKEDEYNKEHLEINSQVNTIEGQVEFKHPRKEWPKPFKPIVSDEKRTKEAYRGGGIIYTITSTKGGVGKTTISTNLAYLLANSKNKPRVCLVDLMKTHGNVATRLLVPENPNVSDWKPYINRDIDQHTVLSSLVVRQRRTGVYAVPAVPEHFELTIELASYILNQLKKLFDYIVIDVSAVTDNPNDNDFVEYILNQSEKVFGIIDYDNATIHDMQRKINNWHDNNLNLNKISLIINFEPSKQAGITRENIQEYFPNIDIAGYLPETEGLRTIHNKGKVISENEKNQMTKQLKSIFNKYEPTIEIKKSFLSKLLRS